MQGGPGLSFGDPLGFGEEQGLADLQDEPLGGPEDVEEPPPPAYDSVVLQSTVVRRRRPPPPACLGCSVPARCCPSPCSLAG